MYFLWWSIYSNLLPFSLKIGLFSYYSVVEFFIYSGYKSFIRYRICKYFSQAVSCLFIINNIKSTLEILCSQITQLETELIHWKMRNHLEHSTQRQRQWKYGKEMKQQEEWNERYNVSPEPQEARAERTLREEPPGLLKTPALGVHQSSDSQQEKWKKPALCSAQNGGLFN